MTIEEVFTNKKEHLALLLLADEQEDMIDRYLSHGCMFRLIDGGSVKCVAVVTALSETECELKNLATDPPEQGKGYGRAMVSHLQNLFFAAGFQTMFVGTGEVPKSLRFYERCGFRRSHRLENFFRDNYNFPIIEDGILLRDMIYLRADRPI